MNLFATMKQLSGKWKYYLLICLPVIINLGNPRWSSVFVIFLSLSWILEGGLKEKFQRGLRSPLFIGFFLLFLCYPMSLLYTEHLGNGWFNVEKHLSFLFIPLIILTSEITKKHVDQILDFFVYSLVVLLVFCLLVAIHSYLMTGETEVRVGEIIANKFQYYGFVRAIPGWHPTYIAMYLNLAIAIMVVKTAESWRVAGNNIKWLQIMILLFCVVSVLLLSSMAGIVSLVIVLLFLSSYLLIKYRKKRVLIIFIVVFTAVTGGTAIIDNRISESFKSFYFDEIKPTDDQSERNNLTIRLAKWETSFEVIRDNFWFGVAPGDTKYELYKGYMKNQYTYLASKKYNAHNQYLEIMLAFGIVGFSIFTFICGYCLFRGFSEKNLLLITVIFVVGLTCVSESILDRQQGIMFFSLFLPLLTIRGKNN